VSADIVVIGSLNTDYVVRGDHLPRPGETVQGDMFREEPGGKGGNQAVAAARLGAKVALIGRVGADERGDRLRRRVASEGVEAAHLGRDETEATGVAIIAIDPAGEKQIVAAMGANGALGGEHVEAARATITSAKVLLAQFQIPPATIEQAVRMAHEAGLTTLLDPAPAVPLPDDFLAMVDVLRCNAGEAEVLTGVQVRDPQSAGRAAAELLRRGVGAAIVQAGPAGDLLVAPDGERFLPRHAVESIDATGAGDAFAAGVATGIAEGRSLAEAAALGSAAAALATTRLGAQSGLPRRDEVEKLLRP
jgi:ribokinase